MIVKTIGYILSAVGLVILGITTFPIIKKLVESTLKYKIAYSNTVLTTIGIIFILAGLFLSISKKWGGKIKQKNTEVPIYHGKHIVGYRRI